MFHDNSLKYEMDFMHKDVHITSSKLSPTYR